MSIIALSLYYLVLSFQTTLPWAVCLPEWENCVPSIKDKDFPGVLHNASVSSAEMYFKLVIIHDIFYFQVSDGNRSLFRNFVFGIPFQFTQLPSSLSVIETFYRCIVNNSVFSVYITGYLFQSLTGNTCYGRTAVQKPITNHDI